MEPDYLAALNAGDWFAIAGLILAGVGIALSIIFYLRSKRVRSLRYVTNSVSVLRGLSSRTPRVEISFGGNQVSTVTATTVAVWNAGRETVRASDIPSADPLALKVRSDGRVLVAKVQHRATRANNFEASIDAGGQMVLLSFDYLDRNQGAVVELLHTGTLDDIELTGYVVGAGPPRKQHYSSESGATINLRYHMVTIVAIFLAMAIGLLAGAAFVAPELAGRVAEVPSPSAETDDYSARWLVTGVAAGIAIVIGIGLMVLRIVEPPIPPDLNREL